MGKEKTHCICSLMGLRKPVLRMEFNLKYFIKFKTVNLMVVFSNRLELLQYYFCSRDRKHRHRHNSDYQSQCDTHTDFSYLGLEDSRVLSSNFTFGIGSFACMLINLMRCGMTPAGVPAYEKNMYLAGRGQVHFSPKSYKYKLSHKMYKNT